MESVRPRNVQVTTVIDWCCFSSSSNDEHIAHHTAAYETIDRGVDVVVIYPNPIFFYKLLND